MGYSYECKSGRLCCDSCGQAGATKCRCPFGWCPPPALCTHCREKHATELTREAHQARGCQLHAAEAALRDLRQKTLLAEGKPVRCAALRYKDGRIHVLFALDPQHHTKVGRFMARETYHAIDLLEPATPDDYARHGVITEAPAAFDFSAT